MANTYAANFGDVVKHAVLFEIIVLERPSRYLESQSARELAEGLTALGRSATVEVADGLTGVCERARRGDLVLLDPFDVHERSGTFSSMEAFAALATRGVSTILWYAIYDPSESGEWIAGCIPSTVTRGWSARLVGDATEGGLAGCGFLTAHLSAASEAITSAAAAGAAAAGAGVT